MILVLLLLFICFVCSAQRKGVHVTGVAGCMQGTECARASHVSLGFNKQLGRLRCQHGPISIFITVKQPNRRWPQHSSRSQRDSYSNLLPCWFHTLPTPMANPLPEPMPNFPFSPTPLSLPLVLFMLCSGRRERGSGLPKIGLGVINKSSGKKCESLSGWPAENDQGSREEKKILIRKCHRSITEPERKIHKMQKYEKKKLSILFFMKTKLVN